MGTLRRAAAGSWGWCTKMRRQLLTDHILAQIPQWVRVERLSPDEIARRIGCTVGTLRVRCSHHRISLRLVSTDRRNQLDRLDGRPRVRLSLSLPSGVRDRLQEWAALRGISRAKLLTLLIETIDKDSLYGAVLDDAVGAAASISQIPAHESSSTTTTSLPHRGVSARWPPKCPSFRGARGR
jgi:hypothetical protein